MRKFTTLAVCLAIIIGGSFAIYKKVESTRKEERNNNYQNSASVEASNREANKRTIMERVNRMDIPEGLKRDFQNKLNN